MSDTTALIRCLELAREAVNSGNDAFGSLLATADGRILREEFNTVGSGNPTAHPELALVFWAVEHCTPSERASLTVYTSGEHCAMCAAAHAWAGLGPIVFAGSTAQLGEWQSSWGAPAAPIRPLSIGEIAPGIVTRGPCAEFADQLRTLHHRAWESRTGAAR